MRTIVKGRNIDVPDVVRAYAERKVARLERLLDDRTAAVVELSVEPRRSVDDAHIAEVTLVIDGQPLRCRAAGPTYQAAIDMVTDKAERQAVDYKEKPRVRARPVEEKQLLSRLADGTAEPIREPRIVKLKRFDNVLYRRLDGDFGLIEPVLGNGNSTGRDRSQRNRATASAPGR